MTLREFRDSQNLTLAEMARALGIGHGANPARRMQRIETGEAAPSPAVAFRIVEFTEGKVTHEDLARIQLAFSQRQAAAE